MKELEREKLSTPIYVYPKDTIRLTYTDGVNTETVLEREIGEEMVLDEVVIFSVEKGDFGAEAGIGGAFLQMKKINKEV